MRPTLFFILNFFKILLTTSKTYVNIITEREVSNMQNKKVMKTFKSNNALAIIIPLDIRMDLNIEAGDYLIGYEEDGKFIVEKKEL